MIDQQRTQPKDGEKGRRERPDDEEPDRFDKDQQDRTRAVPEQSNQGQGPLNVGDQSRARN